MTTTLSRRTVLRHLATGVGVGALGLAACTRVDTARLSAELVALVSDRAAAEAIGRVYLEQATGSTRDTLAHRLASELGWRSDMTSEDLADRLIARIQRDFAEGRTVRGRFLGALSDRGALGRSHSHLGGLAILPAPPLPQRYNATRWRTNAMW